MSQVATVSRGEERVPAPLPEDAVQRLLETLADPHAFEGEFKRPHKRRWRKRDYAMILTYLVTGMRASELCGVDLGHVSSPLDTSGARNISIMGKGNSQRFPNIEGAVADVTATYLESRKLRFPDTAKQGENVWNGWGKNEPLFVDTKGERIVPSTVYYRVKSAFEVAGITDKKTEGAVTHQLRHTFATLMAQDPNITPYQLKNLLGHAALSSTERYTLSAGKDNRVVASKNPVYGMI